MFDTLKRPIKSLKSLFTRGFVKSEVRGFDLENYNGEELNAIAVFGKTKGFEVLKQMLNEKRNSRAISIVVNGQSNKGKNEDLIMFASGQYEGYVDVLKLPEIAEKELNKRAVEDKKRLAAR